MWRAWVLCRHDSGRVLYVPCAFLFLTSCERAYSPSIYITLTRNAVSVVSTIVIRVILIVRTDHGLVSPQLSRAIDITQVANLAFTLLTNGSATGIISAKAWCVYFRSQAALFIQLAQEVSKDDEAESTLR